MTEGKSLMQLLQEHCLESPDCTWEYKQEIEAVEEWLQQVSFLAEWQVDMLVKEMQGSGEKEK